MRARPAAALVGVAFLFCFPACGGEEGPDGGSQVVVAEVGRPGPPAMLGDGGFLFGERDSGRIRIVDAEGRLQVDPVAAVPVAGPRGQLLGLAIDIGERIYAAWTQADGRLVVGWVDSESRHLIWKGPRLEEEDGGGQIGFSPNGHLVVSTGYLDQSAIGDEERAWEGKLLELEPDGPPNQRPEVFSSGWVNPVAFTFDDEGRLWVADAPREGSPRLGTHTPDGPARIVGLDTRVVPTGIASIGDDLVVCDSRSGDLAVYREGRKEQVLASDCSSGVTLRDETSVLFSTENAIKTIVVK